MVERQPSKLNVAGSTPVSRSEERTAHVAQLVERVLGKDEVTSSILVVGSEREEEKKKDHEKESEPIKSKLSQT